MSQSQDAASATHYPATARDAASGSPSLRVRVVALFCITFAVGAGALLLLIANLQARAVLALLDDQAQSVAHSIARLAYDRVAANDRVGLATQLETFNQMQRIRSIAITDRQGQLFSAVSRNAAGNMNAASERDIGRLGTPGIPTSAGPALLAGGEPRRVWVAVGEIAPIGWVRLEYEAGILEDNRRTILLAGGGLLLVLLGIGAALLAVSMNGPLRALRSLAERIDGLAQRGVSLDHTKQQYDALLPAEVDAIASAVVALEASLARWRRARHDSLAQAQRLMDALPDALILIDTEMRPLHANPAWTALLSQISGQTEASLTAVLADEEHARIAAAIVAAATGDTQAFQDTLCVARSDDAGCNRWLTVSGYRLPDPEGGPPHLLLHAQAHAPEQSAALTRAG